MLRRVRGPDQINQSKKEVNKSGNLSMQMDSIDRGSLTADFGAAGASNMHSSSSLLSDKDQTGYHAIVEEICQTFTTLRDFKRKEALEVLSQLVLKAKFHLESSKSAHEAI